MVGERPSLLATISSQINLLRSDRLHGAFDFDGGGRGFARSGFEQGLGLFVTFLGAGNRHIGGRDIFAEAGDTIGAGSVGARDHRRPAFDVGGDFGVTDGFARGILNEAEIIG